MKYRIFLNGRKVAEILVQRGHTRSWFADRIGVSPTYVWMLMNQRAAPSPKTAGVIRKALGNPSWDDIFSMEASTGAA